MEVEKILNKYNRKDDKILVLLHDQKVGDVKIKMLGSNIMVYATEGEVGWFVPNRENIFRNYAKAIQYSSNSANWIERSALEEVKNHEIVNHRVQEWFNLLSNKLYNFDCSRGLKN